MPESKTERETVKTGNIEGHDFEIIRTNEQEFAGGTGFEYEFVLFVNGEQVKTAGELETDGWEKPWIPALERYAGVYCTSPAVGGGN